MPWPSSGAHRTLGAAAESSTGESWIVLCADDGNEGHWAILKDKLKAEGIELEVRTLSDGVQLNQGVQDGALDVNLFQHLIFLSQFNVNSTGTLVPVGATAVYPLALYSEKFKTPGGGGAPGGRRRCRAEQPHQPRPSAAEPPDRGSARAEGGRQRPLDTRRGCHLADHVQAIEVNQTVAALHDGSAQAAVVNNTGAEGRSRRRADHL